MKLNVCTFNIRTATAHDGINDFSFRQKLIAREFPKYEADIIGFQEVQPVAYMPEDKAKELMAENDEVKNLVKDLGLDIK